MESSVPSFTKVNVKFKDPARIIVAGPSCCGKTTFLKNLLTKKENLKRFFPNPVTKILWCYSHEQPAYKEIARANPLVEFHEGLPDIAKEFPTPYPDGKTAIVVLDDLMKLATKSDDVLDIFTQESHHLKFTCFLVLQNLFHQAKNAVDLKRNCSNIVYFRNPSDVNTRSLLLGRCFARQDKTKVERWLKGIDRKPYSHFLLDFHPETPDEHKIRANILDPIIRMPKL